MAPPTPGAAAGSRHRGRARLLAVDQSRAVHTTTARLVAGCPSCRCSSASERVEVAPFVSLVDRVVGVGDRVCLVDLCGSVPCEQRCQRVIDEFGVSCACSGSSSICEQVGVNGRADPSASHAMIMPLMWHDHKSARMVNECRGARRALQGHSTLPTPIRTCRPAKRGIHPVSARSIGDTAPERATPASVPQVDLLLPERARRDLERQALIRERRR